MFNKTAPVPLLRDKDGQGRDGCARGSFRRAHGGKNKNVSKATLSRPKQPPPRSGRTARSQGGNPEEEERGSASVAQEDHDGKGGREDDDDDVLSSGSSSLAEDLLAAPRALPAGDPVLGDAAAYVWSCMLERSPPASMGSANGAVCHHAP